MEKTGFIYIWRDRKKNMYYIGCHWGHENDGYICSSNRMREAYRRRPQDFKRRIIQRGIPREHLLEEEFKWLFMIPKEELGKKYYNHSQKHFGHWSANPQKVQSMREKNLGPNNPRFGKKHTDEWKQNAAERMKGNAYTKGTTLSEEHRKKVSEGVRKAYQDPTKSPGTKGKPRRIINTPYGIFFGYKEASETLNMDKEKIRHKIRCQKYPDWSYI